jgi:integrase
MEKRGCNKWIMKKAKEEVSSKSKNKWERTKYQGVYYRLSEGERVEEGGKPDKCFFIRYKKEGRGIWEKVGWGGDGYSAETAKGIRGERVRAIWHGEELPKEKARIPRFSEMAKIYLEWTKENKSRDKDDRGRYENHLNDPLGKKRLNEISSFDLEKVKSDLIKKELSPATVKHCLVLVREIFNKAIEWGKYKGSNPVKGVKMPTLSNARERFLSHEEADLLLKEIKGVSEAVHDQALLSLHCGLRAGEIFNLRGQDLDFQNGLIRVMDPKNKKSRTAFMTEAVKEMLKERLPDNLNDLIFFDWWHGEKIKLVSRTFARAVENLGFNKGVTDRRQRVVFHTLRHTFGSWLAIQGTPILTIKELMGHKTLAMTERYAHLSPNVKKDATLALEAAFNQSRNGKTEGARLEVIS